MISKEQLFSRCPVVRVSYAVPGGLVCSAEAVLTNHIHAAFDDHEDSDTRFSDCHCICGRCCRTNVGGGNVHWCINPDCDEFQVHVVTPNGR